MALSRAGRFAPSLLAIPWLVACGSAPPPPPDPAAQVPPVPVPPAGAPAAPGSPAAPGAPPAVAGGAGPGRAAPPAPALVPLPTPQQVIAALPLGRPDPFASPFPIVPPVSSAAPGSAAAGTTAAGSAATNPPPAAGAAPAAAAATPGGSAAGGGTPSTRPFQLRPAPLLPPDGFRITGLIRAGGVNEAVVVFGDQTGSLRRGDRGGLTTDLLPRGWSVATVDVNRGHLTLQRGRQRVTVEL